MCRSASLALCAATLFAAPGDIYLLDHPTAAPRRIGHVENARQLALAQTGQRLLVLDADGHVWRWSPDSPQFAIVAGMDDVAGIAAGAGHSLALRRDGGVWAWGANDQGQLGDGSLIARDRPVRVESLSNVTRIAAGIAYSVARTADGRAWVWGSNWQGIAPGDPRKIIDTPVRLDFENVAEVEVLRNRAYASGAVRRDWGPPAESPRWSAYIEGQPRGIGVPLSETTDARTTGIVAPAAASPRTISIGGIEFLDGTGTVALGNDGRVWVWGMLRDRLAPSPILTPQPSDFRKIVRGSTYFMALRAGGSVCTWGYSDYFALGLGLGVYETPTCTTVSGLADIVDLAAEKDSSYALRADGTVWAWGRNDLNQLGDGTTDRRPSPIQIPGLSGVVKIAPRLAVRGDGTLWTWGQINFLRNAVPSPVAGLTGITAAAIGDSHVLALRSDGSLWAFGSNIAGQLGATSGFPGTLVQVNGLPERVTAIAAGAGHSLAQLQDGTIWAWGGNPSGELGDGTNAGRARPVRVPGLTGVRTLAAGDHHSAALLDDGSVRSWGRYTGNGLGEPTQSEDQRLPGAIPGLTQVRAVSAGDYHSLALRDDGSVWSWGLDGYGQLGDCGLRHRDRPAPAGIAGVVAIAAGGNHSLALLAGGSVLAWGRNHSGALGDGGLVSRCQPLPVAGLSGVIAIAARSDLSAALKSDGTVWTWGFEAARTPVRVQGLSGVTAIAFAGSLLALKTNGTLAEWKTDNSISDVPGIDSIRTPGSAAQVRLAVRGDGSAWAWDGGTAPSQLSGLSGVTELASGGAQGLGIDGYAVTTDGSVWRWWLNDFLPLTRLAGPDTARSIAAGFGHFIVAGNDGTVRTWGRNEYGQLGRGVSPVAASPIVPTPVPLLPVIPLANSALPATGTGTRQTFTFAFEHNAGAERVSVANILINGALDGRSACYLAYVPASPTTGTLYLVNDAGSPGGLFAGTLSLPNSSTIANSQCAIQGAGSAIFMSGARLTLTLDISFAASFAGRHVVHLAARDADGGNSGWYTAGVWSVPAAPANPLRVDGLDVTSVGANSTVTATFSSSAGASGIDIVNLLLNSALDGRLACYLAVVPATGTVYLVNDAGDAGGPFAGSFLLGQAGAARQSSCKVLAGNSSVTVIGASIVVRLNISFSPRRSPWIVYAAARDRAGNNTGWQPMAVLPTPFSYTP